MGTLIDCLCLLFLHTKNENNVSCVRLILSVLSNIPIIETFKRLMAV